jgi:hypothetical protein
MKELTEIVRVFGLPFMRSNCSLEALCDSMERHLGWADTISYSLPVTYLILGRTGLAHEYIARRLAELERTPSLATDQYLRFAKRFAKRLVTVGEDNFKER